MNCLLANQERLEEGGVRMLCRCGGGMQGEKRKFGLSDVIAPPVTPFGNTTSELIDKYLYKKYCMSDVSVLQKWLFEKCLYKIREQSSRKVAIFVYKNGCCGKEIVSHYFQHALVQALLPGEDRYTSQ
jgi:hypothetical protein